MPKPKLPAPPFVEHLQLFNTYLEVDEILRSPDFVPGGTPERRALQGDTLVMLSGDEHVARKQVFAPLFSRSSLEEYEASLLDPEIERAMAELRFSRGADGLVRADLVPLIRVMLHRISARVTGVDGVDTPERTERFCGLVARMGAAASGQYSVREPHAVLDDGLTTLRQLVEEFLQPSLDRRRDLVRRLRAGALSLDELPRDVLTLICLNGDDSRARSDDTPHYAYVWREAVLFLSASTQTTTHTLPHVFVHLDQWLHDHPDDADKVGDTTFLRSVVIESLRMHQTSPVKFRVAARDVTTSTGRTVKKGEMVALDAPAANLEPEVFGANAAEFNPHRERPPGVMPYGTTFGAGVHMCLGRSLVIGRPSRAADEVDTDGTMVKIVRKLYSLGFELDPDDPPTRTSASFHDAYDRMPFVLRHV